MPPAKSMKRLPSTSQISAFSALSIKTWVATETPRGVAESLGLPHPHDLEDEAEALLSAARRLLEELAAATATDKAAKVVDTRGLAWMMARGGWGWGNAVLAALGVQGDSGRGGGAARAWERLPVSASPSLPPRS